VHPTATVEPEVVLGRDTQLWHHVHVRAGAVLGDGTMLGKGVYVDAGVRIGARVRIQNNVSIYAGVELEDDVFVGPSAVFTNDRVPRAGSVDFVPVPTLVRRGASIGANATLVCGIEIGAWAMIGAGAVVTRSVATHELVFGNPARRAGWVCVCGTVALRTTDALPAATRCPQCGRTLDGSS
jgi:acetyltransferase-like isoleucine patch superfamily enzyme